MENEIKDMEVVETEITEVEETYTPDCEEGSSNGVGKAILIGAGIVAGAAAIVWNSKWAKAKRAEWNDKRRAKKIADLEKEGYLVSYPAECEDVTDENDVDIPEETEE